MFSLITNWIGTIPSNTGAIPEKLSVPSESISILSQPKFCSSSMSSNSNSLFCTDQKSVLILNSKGEDALKDLLDKSSATGSVGFSPKSIPNG